MIVSSRNLSARRAKSTSTKFCRTVAFAAAAVALLAGADPLRAASATFTGTAGDNNFENGANWSTGTPPGDTTAGVTTNADVATFGLATGATITETAQHNLGSISITGGATASFVIGATAGPAFLLSSGGTISSTGGSAQVNAPLVLQNAAASTGGVYTIDASTPGTSRSTIFGGNIAGAATTGGTTVLTLQGNSTVVTNSFNGVIADGTSGGTLALVKTGTGTWQVANTANTYTGGTTVTAGILRTGSSGNTTAIFGTGAITFNGGILNLGSTTATTVNNAVVVAAGTTSTLLVRTNDNFNPTSMTGTGTLILNNSNSAATVVTSNSFQNFGGTVDVEPNGTFGTQLRLSTTFVQTSLQNATVNIGASSAVFQQGGTSSTVTTQFGALSGTGTLGASGAGSGTFVYQVGGNNSSTTFAGTIVNGGSLTALTKVGTGMLTLGAANSYTGATAINGGRLVVTANGGLSTSNVTIAAGFTLELGTGVTAAHSANTATLTLVGTTSVVMLDAAAGTVQDSVAALVINGVSQPVGTYGGTGSGAGTILSQFTGTGVLAVVPEPSAWVFLWGGAAGLAALAVRRQRAA